MVSKPILATILLAISIFTLISVVVIGSHIDFVDVHLISSYLLSFTPNFPHKRCFDAITSVHQTHFPPIPTVSRSPRLWHEERIATFRKWSGPYPELAKPSPGDGLWHYVYLVT